MGITRRAFLAVGAFVGLTGCSSDGQDAPTSDSTKSAEGGTVTEKVSQFEDNTTITETSYVRDAREGAVAAYNRVGKPEEMEYTYDIVGTRRLACQWPMVPRGGPIARAEPYRNTGTNELVQLVRYSFVEQPPNMVPVLKAIPSMAANTAGETFEIGVKLRSQPDTEWLMTFGVGPDTDTHHLYDEIRLNEVPNGSAARGTNTLPDTSIEVHAGIGTRSAEGTVYPGSQLMLEWEVV